MNCNRKTKEWNQMTNESAYNLMISMDSRFQALSGSSGDCIRF